MKIKTVGNKVRIKMQENTAGSLDLESMPTAVECGEVIDIGSEVNLDIKKGDKVLYKAWAIDIINYAGEKYYFLDLGTKGLCAIIHDL